MGEMLVSLCAPAKRLMAQFNYSVKFILISIIFIVPLVLSLALLQFEYSEEIRFTEKELEGLELVNQISVEQRKLAEALINGSSNFSSGLSSITQQLSELDAQPVSSRLNRYQQSLTQQDRNTSFSALIALNQSIADYSNLELDLELATSYLVTTLVETLPQAQAQVAKTADLARVVLNSGSFTPDTYIDLSNANQKLSLMIMNVDESLAVSLESNRQIAAQLANRWKSLKSELEAYKSMIQERILDPDSFEIQRDELNRVSLNTNQKLYEFESSLEPVLAEQLAQRIDSAVFKNRIIFTISLIAVLLAAYLFTGMYQSVIENIKRVVMGVHCIAEGKLSTRVSVEGRDEMRDIANDMNHMAENFENLVFRLSEAIRTLSESSLNLKSVTERTIDGVQKQKSGTDSISGSMSTLTQVASDVDELSERASESAINAVKEAQQGLTLVNGLQTVMKDMQNESSRSQEALNRLVEDSKDIGQVSSAINEIAEQTNLLALNAAIEAARAGEQGRGFAVVADEVRTLAQRTQAQTNQIHEIISKLQQATQDTRESMEQSREQMNLSVQEASVVGSALEQISQVVENIKLGNVEISELATQQSNVTRTVASKVEEIALISESTRLGAVETDQSADGLSHVVKTLQDELSTVQKGD